MYIKANVGESNMLWGFVVRKYRTQKTDDHCMPSVLMKVLLYKVKKVQLLYQGINQYLS